MARGNKSNSASKEGGTPKGIDRNSDIEDKVFAEDWSSPMNANNSHDSWPENNFEKPSQINPANPMGYTGIEGGRKK